MCQRYLGRVTVKKVDRQCFFTLHRFSPDTAQSHLKPGGLHDLALFHRIIDGLLHHLSGHNARNDGRVVSGRVLCRHHDDPRRPG